jgi:hypothetical protein
MPIRELRCNTEDCEYGGIVFEWFASSANKPDPHCPKCKAQMERLVSNFNCPWTGTLDKYKEGNRERFNEFGDGHWVWDAPKVWDDSYQGEVPKRHLIRTRQDQLEHCRRNNLIPPEDINSNAEISADGKTLCTTGMKGQWLTGMPGEEIRSTGRPWLYVDE